MSTAKAIPQFPHLVGFEQLFEQITRPSRKVCYPPHNIVKVSDTQYTIELAVAGFVMKDLTIVMQDHVLVVTGTPNTKNEVEYIYKGLSTRAFVKKFDLADNVKVKGATIAHGILTIELNVVTPSTESIQIDIKEEL